MNSIWRPLSPILLHFGPRGRLFASRCRVCITGDIGSAKNSQKSTAPQLAPYIW